MKTLIVALIVLVVSLVVIALLTVWLMCWLTKTLSDNFFPRFVNGESIYNSEYQTNFIYTGEKRTTEGNLIAIIKGRLIELDVKLDKATLKDNKKQLHVVSLKSLKEFKTIKN